LSTSTINANEAMSEADILSNQIKKQCSSTMTAEANILPSQIGKRCLSTLQTNRPLSAWLYRKSHVVESASGAGADYQKRIKVFKSNEFPMTLTLLNARTSLAFTIPGGSDWTERSFGSLVPLRTRSFSEVLEPISEVIMDSSKFLSSAFKIDDFTSNSFIQISVETLSFLDSILSGYLTLLTLVEGYITRREVDQEG